MSQVFVGVRAKRALYMVGALVVALSIAVVSAAKAEAQPMTASWYGPGFAGSPTASGEIFDPQAMTAAHKTLPFGTQLEVCYNGCTTVTVNDRGPFIPGRDLDLSQGAAQAIGLGGVGTVDVTILGQGGGSAEPAPEPAPEPAAEPVQEEAAPQQAATPQASDVQEEAAPQQAATPQASDVQNLSQEVDQSSEATTVNVFEQSPNNFVANVVVPVGPEGYQAAYQEALELAQQRANAAAGLV